MILETGLTDSGWNSGRRLQNVCYNEKRIMQIAIIGTGDMGSALGELFVRHGHEVILGSRNPQAASRLAAEIDAREATTYQKAAQSSEIICLCIQWRHREEVLSQLGDLSGRILIDVSNPEAEDGRSPAIGATISGAELIAQRVAGAKVVKAFNYIYADLLRDAGALKKIDPSIFLCGDDVEARKTVSSLIRSCQLEPIDCGGLSMARYLEPLAFLMVQLVRVQGWPPDRVAMKLSHDRRS